MVSQKLGGTPCWLVLCLLAAAAAAPLATAARINAVPKAAASIFQSISVYPPMVGTGSKVTVTVVLKTAATSAPQTYTLTTNNANVKCDNVTFAAGQATATATCVVDPGCELGSYTVTVTAPASPPAASDSKTSIDYHVACKNVFDMSYGPFKVIAPGCQDCFQDCVTKLFTCLRCQCKCATVNSTRTTAGTKPRNSTKDACDTAPWCECDDVVGVVVEDHQCDEVRYDSCDNKMKCKVNEYYYESHKPEYREYEYEEMRKYQPEIDDDEEEEVERAYRGDGGRYRSEGEGNYGNREPHY